jgi:hypothetical protein
MLWNASSLVGYAIEATDGTIGSADDPPFDDRFQAIRRLVDMKNWWPGKRR